MADVIRINPLPDDKILGLPKLKAFVDNKLDVTRNVKVVFHRLENIVGKEENAGLPAFSSFPIMFLKKVVFFFPPVRQKSSLRDKELNDTGWGIVDRSE